MRPRCGRETCSVGCVNSNRLSGVNVHTIYNRQHAQWCVVPQCQLASLEHAILPSCHSLFLERIEHGLRSYIRKGPRFMMCSASKRKNAHNPLMGTSPSEPWPAYRRHMVDKFCVRIVGVCCWLTSAEHLSIGPLFVALYLRARRSAWALGVRHRVCFYSHLPRS